MALLGYNGLVNTEILEPLFGIRIVLQGMFAIVFVQSAHYFTLILSKCLLFTNECRSIT